MFFQIEITTKCNYRCFYCAGRQMPQRHMKQEVFDGILNGMPGGRHTVSLQGEGEPTVHPRFWALVDQVARRGHIPYTITNGSLIEPELAHRRFPNLGVSLDTLDATEAQRIGRLKLPEMLANLNTLIRVMGPGRIVLHTVDTGQDLSPVKRYARAHGLRHLIQPLQRKDDYARLYPDRIPQAVRLQVPSGLCRYLATDFMRFFNIEGIEFPCCFIKDASGYAGISDLRQRMRAGEVPGACRGCAEIPRARGASSALGRAKTGEAAEPT